MELWDVYNQYRKKVGRLHERGKSMAQGDYHIVVHVWIINSAEEILIQKRQPWKKGSPNMWDSSAAGSAIQGDDSKQAALREVKEELGIDLDMSRAEILFTIKFSKGFNDIWFVRQDIDLNDLKLQEEEVADAKWVTFEELKNMVSKGEFIDYSYLDRIEEAIHSTLSLQKVDSERDEFRSLQQKVLIPLFEDCISWDKAEESKIMDRFIKDLDAGDYYKILYEHKEIGSLFVYEKESGIMQLHFIHILKAYENRGIGQKILHRMEAMYPQAEGWKAEMLIPEKEKKNPYLFEKMGYIECEKIPVGDGSWSIIVYEKQDGLNKVGDMKLD